MRGSQRSIPDDSDFTRITSGIDRTNRNNDSLYYKPYSKNASAWSKMALKFELFFGFYFITRKPEDLNTQVFV